MTRYIGIDPGVAGAIALIDHYGVRIYDTPVVQVKVGKTIKNQMDPAACALLLNQLSADSRDATFVVLEKVMPMPSFKVQRKGEEPTMQSMGVTSAFNFGQGLGIWIGILAGLLLPYQLVHPATWKKAMLPDMSKDKGNSIIRAKQLFPSAAHFLARKKDDGRAEALLLAAYGKKYHGESVVAPPPISTSLFPEDPF